MQQGRIRGQNVERDAQSSGNANETSLPVNGESFKNNPTSEEEWLIGRRFSVEEA